MAWIIDFDLSPNVQASKPLPSHYVGWFKNRIPIMVICTQSTGFWLPKIGGTKL